MSDKILSAQEIKIHRDVPEVPQVVITVSDNKFHNRDYFLDIVCGFYIDIQSKEFWARDLQYRESRRIEVIQTAGKTNHEGKLDEDIKYLEKALALYEFYFKKHPSYTAPTQAQVPAQTMLSATYPDEPFFDD